MKSDENSPSHKLPPAVPPSRAAMRRLLQALLRSESEFEAFYVDYFREVHSRFVVGMDQVARVNLLLETTKPASVLAALREVFVDDPSALNTIDTILSKPQTDEQRQAQEQWETLERLGQKRVQLKKQGQSTADVDKEIVNIKRKQRQGGPLGEGALLDNRYRLIESIGRGGFATVWKAFDRTERQEVAIKILHREQGDHPRRLERFERGARQMRRLRHPHIVQVLDGPAEHEEFHYFVMVYVEGGDLFHAVLSKRVDRTAGLQAVLQIGAALAYAHQEDMVHRDVKPQNILLDANNQAQLTDFDLVWAADTTGDTRTGFLGTHIYAAPEQAENAKSVDRRADIYSLGMTVLFLLHGTSLPQQALYQRGLFIDELKCPDPVKALLRLATAIDADDRPQTIADFCTPLAAALGLEFSLQPSAAPVRSAKLASKRKLPRRLVLGLLASVLILAIGGGGYWMFGRSGELVLTTAPGRELMVLVDQKPVSISDSPVRLRLLSGQHEVELRHSGYQPWTDKLHIAAGELLVRNIQMEQVRMETGGFTLISEPPGATASIDGTSLNQVTPMRVQSLLAGKHTLELRLPGRIWRREIQVEPNKMPDIRATLLPTEIPAENGASKPESSKLVQTEAPDKKDTAHKEGGDSPANKGAKSSKAVTQANRRSGAGQTRSTGAESAVAAGMNGYLRINSRPWTKIIVDGQDTGLNTPQTSYRLPAGKHQVTLVNPQFKISKTFEVTVQAGETQTINPIFQVL